jgi:small conductance mechanosensitive channel
MTELTEYLQMLSGMAVAYAPKLLLAIVALIVGLRLVNWVSDVTGKAMERNNVSDDIRPFLQSMISILLKILLLFSVAEIVGIETTSFVAVLAAAGFAVGLALQGSLSNFSAGVMIIIFRPYRSGDLIEVEGEMGHVLEVQIFNTIISTLDNRTVIIPNATAIGGIITNLTVREHLRVDLNITMPYEEDFDKVESILLTALKNTPKVLEDPAPFVGIETFDSHNIVLTARVYAATEDYWDVYFEANRRMKKAMSENGIKVAYSEGVEMGSIGK